MRGLIFLHCYFFILKRLVLIIGIEGARLLSILEPSVLLERHSSLNLVQTASHKEELDSLVLNELGLKSVLLLCGLPVR